MTTKPVRYCLFIDESGDFREGDQRRESDGRDFPSQIGGVLAPAGHFSDERAESILRTAYNDAGKSLEKVVHGKDLKRGRQFHQMIGSLADALRTDAKLQPVRIVNRERLNFGGRVATYTNMLAELAIQVFEFLSKKHDGPVELDITYARWMDDHVQVKTKEYRQRLQERLAQTMARHGRANRAGTWSLGELSAASARTERTLQVCDLLNNGSHDDFCKVDDHAKKALQEALGAFDLGWSVRAMTTRLEDLVSEGALGLALVELAPTLSDPSLSEDERRGPAERLDDVVSALGSMDGPSRDAQLGVLTTWLTQLIDHRGALRRGLEVTDWAIGSLLPLLRKHAGDAGGSSCDELAFRLHRLALTGANHLGALKRSHQAARALDELVPKVQGRWELAPLLIDALTHQSVHETDALEFDASVKRMAAVADYYRDLSEMFAMALPKYFSKEMRSAGRGRALGTLLQAEAYAGMNEPQRLDDARAHSDEAMKEFADRSDVARQEQYRTLIETIAGDWIAARTWLGKSLELEGSAPDHDTLGAHISSLEGYTQAFALLHWSRIGAFAARRDDRPERDAMLAAAQRHKLLTSSWVSSPDVEYPAHGIRRFLAVALAAVGRDAEALSTLGHLRALKAEPEEQTVLALTVAAGHLEVAGQLWTSNDKAARRLVDGHGANAGLRQQVDTLRAAVSAEMPALRKLVDGWQQVLAGRDLAPDDLLRAGRLIPD